MKIKRNTQQLSSLMSDWLRVYLPYTRMKSQNTVDTYESALSLYLDFLENKKGITAKKLNEDCFRKDWIEEWIAEAHNERGNSKRTCDLRLSCIRSLLKYLADKNTIYLTYYLAAMSIDKLMIGHGKQVEALSKKATAVLFAQMQGSDSVELRDRTLFTFMYDTGARASEVLNIRIEELKLDDKTPYVIINGKGNKPRTLLLSDDTVGLLKAHIGCTYSSKPYPDSYLFPSRTKGRKSHLTVDAANVRLKVYAEKAHEICPEVPADMHTHQLRHTACSHWFEDNINIAQISRYLGHESIETTRIYLGISKEELAAAMAKREPVVQNDGSKYHNVKGGLRSLIGKKK